MSLICMLPLCERTRHPDFAICTACYRMLPDEHRFQIKRCFRPGMTPDDMPAGIRIALNAAQVWIVNTFGGEGKDREDPAAKWERLKRHVRERDEARAKARGVVYTPPEEPKT